MDRRKQVKDIDDSAFSGAAKLTVNKCRILTANSLEEAPGASPMMFPFEEIIVGKILI